VRAYADYLLHLCAPGSPPAAGGIQPQPSDALTEVLTERELEVLRLLAHGYSNQAIAKELIVAVGTVKRHVSNIMGKLQAESRLEAVACARNRGLL
jgi:LuxR family maltose regulon positive regulatory protein